jgi:hypothetical protein
MAARVAMNFDSSFKETIIKLYDTKDSETGEAVFSTLAELMVFCAMVGRYKFDNCNGVEIGSKIREIGSDTFHNLGLDGIAFLLALESQDEVASSGNILRDENEKEMWGYLQDFAFLGLQEIEMWFVERPRDRPHYVILDKMKELAINEKINV